MSGGNPVLGATRPPALVEEHFNELYARWWTLRSRCEPAEAERDPELLSRARSLWTKEFKITRVIATRLQAKAMCFCGGSGYLPLWVAEALDHGLRPATYESAWGWRPVYCLVCQAGTELVLDSIGVPEGEPCEVCDGCGITPAWVGHVLCGSPSGLDWEQRATGWFPSYCRHCGGWGRVLPRAVDEAAQEEVLDAPVASVVVDSSTPTTAGLPSFRRVGKVWEATYLGRAVHLQDRVGTGYLSILVDRPGQSVPALELVASRGLSSAAMTTSAALEEGLRIGGAIESGATIDAKAAKAYRERWAELGAEIAEAERHNNPGRADKLRNEQEVLKREVLAYASKHGRARRTSPEQTKARNSVQKAIFDSLAEIEATYGELATHLRERLTFGASPSYRGD